MPEFNSELFGWVAAAILAILWYRDRQNGDVDEDRSTAIEAFANADKDEFLKNIAKSVAMGKDKDVAKIVKNELKKKA